mgnify:CR=1 FL=1
MSLSLAKENRVFITQFVSNSLIQNSILKKLYIAIIFIALNSAFGFGQMAEFSIKDPTHKFPKTSEGILLVHYFIIENIGDAPLILSDYKVSCTCTKLFLPEKPILPGETYRLKLTFDTHGKYYFQDRIIYVKANTKKGTHKLRMKVNVIPKEEK